MATAFCKNVQKYDDWCKSCMQPKICSKMSRNSIFSGINFMMSPLRILQIGGWNWSQVIPRPSLNKRRFYLLGALDVVGERRGVENVTVVGSSTFVVEKHPLKVVRSLCIFLASMFKIYFFLRLWRRGILYFLSPALHLKPKRCSTREGSALTRKFTELESSQGKTLAYFSLPPATKRKNISSVCPYQTFSGRS